MYAIRGHIAEDCWSRQSQVRSVDAVDGSATQQRTDAESQRFSSSASMSTATTSNIRQVLMYDMSTPRAHVSGPSRFRIDSYDEEEFSSRVNVVQMVQADVETTHRCTTAVYNMHEIKHCDHFDMSCSDLDCEWDFSPCFASFSCT